MESELGVEARRCQGVSLKLLFELLRDSTALETTEQAVTPVALRFCSYLLAGMLLIVEVAVALEDVLPFLCWLVLWLGRPGDRSTSESLSSSSSCF